MHVIASFVMALAAYVSDMSSEAITALAAATIIHAVVWVFSTW